MAYPEPPRPEATFWIAFASFMAAMGAITRFLTEEKRRGFWSYLGELISVSFWGGLAGWLLAYYSSLDPPAIAAIGALFGHYGHQGLIFFVNRALGNWVEGPKA